jgi:hypothetical protein
MMPDAEIQGSRHRSARKFAPALAVFQASRVDHAHVAAERALGFSDISEFLAPRGGC